MLLRRLELQDYRNFASQTVELGPRFTVLCGHNGAGKTNVLEAIYLVSTLRSFRTSDQSTLIRHGQQEARVDLDAHDPALGAGTRLSVRLARRGQGARRTAEADGKVVRAASQFYGRIRAVLFTPEDLGVLRGSPTGRRQFMDRVVFARDRAHISDTQIYDKLVRSRNHVLRQPPADGRGKDDMLETYEDELATVGGRLWTRRLEMLARLEEPFRAAFARIHGGETEAHLGYYSKLGEVPAPDRATVLRSALRDRRAEDEQRGATSVGPHRDDLRIDLGGESAGDYASQGQARALVLAFKLAELKAAAELHGTAPLFLLDDVSSELDEERSRHLFETLADEVGQCVLTTTALKFVTLPPDDDAHTLDVVAGTITARSR